MASPTLPRRLLRSVATLVAAMVFYYFVPLPDEGQSIVGVLLSLGGLIALTLLVLLQVLHQLRAPAPMRSTSLWRRWALSATATWVVAAHRVRGGD